ncbi:MAG: homocysteine S-methyltransferase family protein [Candidatus Levybacteria bacterium]|nr:homocysteine S-methyltransferase family protein [Candidatus Levybacteria bacterium]
MQLDQFKTKLHKKEIILKDGAMGTEILRRGTETPIPLWSAYALLIKPELVKEIHKDYIKAGAEIITTDTFSTTARMLTRAEYPAEKAREITLLACSLAKEAVQESGKSVLIAGSVAPLEDCYSPELTPPESELRKEHASYAKDLVDGGVDFILIETMITIRETLAACVAAKKLNIPLAVSFCCTADGKLLGGEDLLDAVQAVTPYSPMFVGINCMSYQAVTSVVSKYRKKISLPFCAYAQGVGSPDDTQGWKFDENENIQQYIDAAKGWAEKGVQIIGSCCGSTPEYTRILSQKLLQK